MDPIDASATINAMHESTFAGRLGLVVTSATRDAVSATLTIAPHHRQPQGIVHGGVYASIIESLASVGAAIDAMSHGKNVVGLENHTTFVRAAREGTLHAKALPITRGRRTQVWDVTIRNEEKAIIATGRVRLLVLDPEVQVGGSELKM
jgi:1,4-dihydroxy-2-naphthoyl-CoA hydrolase